MNLEDLQAMFGTLTTIDKIEVPKPPPRARLVDKQSVKDTVLGKGVRVYYDALSGQEGKCVSDTILYRCWHHDDKHSSMCVSSKHGGYECKACGETNDLIGGWMFIRSVPFKEALDQIAEWCGGALSLPPPIMQSRSTPAEKKVQEKIETRYKTLDPDYAERLERYQRSLHSNRNVLSRLMDNYGVSAEAAGMYKLGWITNESRLAIPVFTGGRLVNIRKHDIMRTNCAYEDKKGGVFKTADFGRTPTWDVKVCRKIGRRGSKVTGVTKHNGNNLYPSGHLATFGLTSVREAGTPNPWICITGGELKAILLNANKIPAVTFTGGETSFVPAWLERFRGLNVDICLDADNAGRKGSEKLAEKLFGIAAQVRVVRLPAGDVTDHYRNRKWDFSDWLDLPREGHTVSPYDQTPQRIRFDEVHSVDMAERPVTMHAIVAGGTDRVKFVICGAKASCSYGEKNPIPNCKKCALPSNGFERSIKVPSDDIITLSRIAPSKQEKRLREGLLGIPPRCPHPEFEFIRARVMPVLLSPDTEVRGVNWSDQRHFILPTYYLGADIPRDNEPVTVTGRVCADPVTSDATMIIDNLKPSKKSIHSAKMSKETEEWLDGLSEHPPGTLQGAHERHSVILRDIEFGITRIYDQRVMLSAYTLLFFMPIHFHMFGERNQKVSPEILVLGDSRQGKTTAANKLMQHFGAGAMIDAEGATYVGLVGGRNEYGSAGKVFAWGALPMNNGGMVFLDEIDGLVEDGIFGKLTSIRSSGIAQRSTAGGNRRTSAALRMIMASNPVGSRRLAQYDSLMYAVRELIKKPADLARFELIVGVYKITAPNFDYSTEEIDYTQEVAQEHLRWAWQQEPVLGKAESQLAADRAKWLCTKYENMPTLEPTEARWKVGRMACAMAALAFSRGPDGKVLVTPDHIEMAANYISEVYSTPQWKIAKAIGHGNIKSDVVRLAIEALGGEKFARIMMTRGSMRTNDFKTAFEITPTVMGMNVFNEVMAALTLYNDCLHEGRGGYYKTEQFRRWLDDTYKAEEVA